MATRWILPKILEVIRVLALQVPYCQLLNVGSFLFRGENLLGFMTNTPSLIASCVTWYLLFYAPMDGVFRLLHGTGLLPFLALPQDWQRIGRK